MPTLYVENVPADLHKALRAQAKRQGRSLRQEVIRILKQAVPTQAELAKRRAAYEYILKRQAEAPKRVPPGPSAEEMIREDRER